MGRSLTLFDPGGKEDTQLFLLLMVLIFGDAALRGANMKVPPKNLQKLLAFKLFYIKKPSPFQPLLNTYF